MGTRLRFWWWKNRIAIRVSVIIFVVVIALIIAGYWFDWTGFNGYNKVTITHIISGTNAGTVTRTEEYQPGKTLWDWLQLLIIPAVLAVAGYIINLTISRGEQAATEQRAKVSVRRQRNVLTLNARLPKNATSKINKLPLTNNMKTSYRHTLIACQSYCCKKNYVRQKLILRCAM